MLSLPFQVFVAALYENNDGEQAIRDYISSVHGPGSDCPHPRVLPNLVSICVAAIFHRQVSPERELARLNANHADVKLVARLRSSDLCRFEVSSHASSNEDKPSLLPPLQCYLLVLNIA